LCKNTKTPVSTKNILLKGSNYDTVNQNKKRKIFYFDLRRYVIVSKATATKTKATPIAAALENSGTDGVGSVVPDGVSIAW
jgi:hypothetical protein